MDGIKEKVCLPRLPKINFDRYPIEGLSNLRLEFYRVLENRLYFLLRHIHSLYECNMLYDSEIFSL